jgi:hypothetical protein
MVRNTSLGESYLHIDAERNPEEYKRLLKTFGKTDDKDIHGFISYEEGTKSIPLYVRSTYFIMTGSGTTFDNLTKR